MIQRTENQ